MRLGPTQLEVFARDGVVVLPGLFDAAEVEALRSAFDMVASHEHPANVIEKQSGAVRTAMALHQRHPTFARLLQDSRLVEPVRQLLGTDDVYAQQVKVNVKAASHGEAWQWHYDFATHHREDGVPEPLALNVHVFLDHVTTDNGPLQFIAGSHLVGSHPTFLDTETTSYDLWCVASDDVEAVLEGREVITAVGPAGTVLVFGDTLLHSSPPNYSDYDRRIFSAILNPMSNGAARSARPDWKHHRDRTAVACVHGRIDENR